MKIHWQGHELTLLPDRALYWDEHEALILSDVHLGKAHDFQRAGIPITAKIHDRDLDRIAFHLETRRVRQVLILGDFVHSHFSKLTELKERFALLKQRSRAHWTLVLGNHDRRRARELSEWAFDALTDEVQLGGVHLVHDRDPKALSISGHVHPVLKMGSKRDRFRLPCFVVRGREIILPAFGEFTGGFEVERQEGQSLYAIADGRIFEFY